VHSIENAAAAGDVTNFLSSTTPLEARIRALVMAADHQRLEVIDRLIAAGTPVDSTDATFGRHPLRIAAGIGRPASVRHLLDHGADPNLKDPEHGRHLLTGAATTGTQPLTQALRRSGSDPTIRHTAARLAVRGPEGEPQVLPKRASLHRASIARGGAMGRSRRRNDANEKWRLSRHLARFAWSADTPDSGS